MIKSVFAIIMMTMIVLRILDVLSVNNFFLTIWNILTQGKSLNGITVTTIVIS